MSITNNRAEIYKNPLVEKLLTNSDTYSDVSTEHDLVVSAMFINSVKPEKLFCVDIDVLYMPDVGNNENISDLFFESQGIGEITIVGRRILFLEFTENDVAFYIAGLVVYFPPTEINTEKTDENDDENDDNLDEMKLNAKFYTLVVSTSESKLFNALGICFINPDNVPDSHLEFAPSEEDFESDDDDDDDDEDEDED